jgi:hypothetical protein
MDALRILADAMNYLDRTYCRGSILEWTHSTPEKTAYLILRELFTQMLEEPVKKEKDCSFSGLNSGCCGPLNNPTQCVDRLHKSGHSVGNNPPNHPEPQRRSNRPRLSRLRLPLLSLFEFLA